MFGRLQIEAGDARWAVWQTDEARDGGNTNQLDRLAEQVGISQYIRSSSSIELGNKGVDKSVF